MRLRYTQRLLALAASVVSFPFTSAHAQSAASVQEHQRLAHIYLDQKQPQRAIPEFQAVLAAEPTNLDAEANLGVLLFFAGRDAEAIPLLRGAVSQQPELGKLQALLGLAEEATGQPAEARADLDAALPKLTENAVRVQAGLALVELDADAQLLDKAAAVLALLRQTAPTDPRVLYAAYRVATDQAGDALLSLSLAAPDSPQMHQAIAHELVRAHDVPGTIANLRQAAALDPDLPGIHYELAQALDEADDPKVRAEAEAEYRLAVTHNPVDALSLAALGDIAVKHSDLPGAAALYTRALTLQPYLEQAEIGAATIDVQRGDDAAAATLLEQALATDPSNSLAHYRLSTVYRRLKRPADAEKELVAYKHFKEMKEKLRVVYRQLRDPEHAADSQGGTP